MRSRSGYAAAAVGHRAEPVDYRSLGRLGTATSGIGRFTIPLTKDHVWS
ncbi:hypothetical protein NJ7G_1901 [Natrinema sp. J7-2]|nr:hypothetical protein NJ7G_1901 [Natrinema sp. J7-2]